MNINEMHYGFLKRVTSSSSLKKPGFLPAEIDSYINEEGIPIFLKNRYGIKGAYSFESNQKIIDALKNLHIMSPHLQPAMNPVAIGSGFYKVELKNLLYEYLFTTAVYVDISDGDCSKKRIRATIVQTDDNNFFQKPDLKWGIIPLRFGKVNSGTSKNIEKGAMFFETSSLFTIDKVYVDYIKYPNRVFFGGYDHLDGQSLASDPQIHCDLDDKFHDEILRIAAQQAEKDLQNIQGFQLQTSQVELDKQTT